MEEEKRNLTEADVNALVNELERRWERRFFLNLGRGLWGAVWKVIVVAIIAIAASGAFERGKWW